MDDIKMDLETEKELVEAIRVYSAEIKGRNELGKKSHQVSITLPEKTFGILVSHAKKFNLTLSRMAHDIIIEWYCHEKGYHREK